MKGIIKISLKGLGIIILTGLLFVSGIYLKYRRIINADRRSMPHSAISIPQAARSMPYTARPMFPLVKEVNPFIGTGGYPWVCGHN
ncbi:MAG: hypothetical protein KAT15_05655, partial [Bacteroidales bacterium]|nr:hypothetical protein [Bacteroidales bacterium]